MAVKRLAVDGETIEFVSFTDKLVKLESQFGANPQYTLGRFEASFAVGSHGQGKTLILDAPIENSDQVSMQLIGPTISSLIPNRWQPDQGGLSECIKICHRFMN